MAAVRAAVQAGQLADLRQQLVTCEDCGQRATRYDHRDYSKPLDVAPVCHGCNLRRGPAAPLTIAVVQALRLRPGDRASACLRALINKAA